jgi:hypothetical protein
MRSSIKRERPIFVECLEARRLFDCSAFGQAVADCAQTMTTPPTAPPAPPAACAVSTLSGGTVVVSPGGGSDFGQAVADAASACGTTV